MRARIGGGIAGWLIGAVPLIVVNVLDYAGLFDLQDAVIAGLIALIGGVLLGGVASGLLGKRGGTISAVASGAIAAFLYAATLIGLVLGASQLNIAPSLIQRHPLRVSMAILFVAAILLAVAIGTGTLAGRGTRDVSADEDQPRNSSAALHPHPSRPQAQGDGRYAGHPSHPNYPSQRQPWTQSRPRPSAPDDVYEGQPRVADTVDYGRGYASGAGYSRPLPPDASNPRYAASHSRSSGSASARRDANHPSHADGWPQSGR